MSKPSTPSKRSPQKYNNFNSRHKGVKTSLQDI